MRKRKRGGGGVSWLNEKGEERGWRSKMVGRRGQGENVYTSVVVVC